MSVHRAAVEWTLKPGEDFAAGRYSRGHTVRFEAHEVPATASRQVVGKWAAPGAVDPEEMLVAALSNCHMLTFLHRARLAGFVATAYRDAAEGVMEKIDSEGRMAVTRVTLKPEIDWQGTAPDAATLERLHHEAHDECFIANSVRTQVVVVSGSPT